MLWYTGQWVQLPGPWRDRHGASPLDVDDVLSPEAYTAGLMWDAIGAHPQGAKAPGFATWVDRPGARPMADLTCDVAIVGAGVAGAILARRLAAAGRRRRRARGR